MSIRKTEMFLKWHASLDTMSAARVRVRIERAGLGNYGDHKRFDGLVELRIHYGSGYRVYCVEHGQSLIVVLAGGDKSSQKADIARAKLLADNL